jgi:hypothetical protein
VRAAVCALRLAERQTDEASIPFTGGTMLKSGAAIL